LAHRHEPRQEARIVPASRDNLGWFATTGNRSLGLRQAASRLHRNPAKNRFAARNSAEHPAMTIRLGSNFALSFWHKWIVVGAAARHHHLKTSAVFETRDGG